MITDQQLLREVQLATASIQRLAKVSTNVGPGSDYRSDLREVIESHSKALEVARLDGVTDWVHLSSIPLAARSWNETVIAADPPSLHPYHREHAQQVASLIAAYGQAIQEALIPQELDWDAQLTPDSVRLKGAASAVKVNGFPISRAIGTQPGTGFSHVFPGMLGNIDARELILECLPGDYPHDTCAISRNPHCPQITFVAPAGSFARIHANPVGGSDSFYIRDFRNGKWIRFVFNSDDRAGLKTEIPNNRNWLSTYHDLQFQECALDGGWDATTDIGPNHTWLCHSYDIGYSDDPSAAFGFVWDGQAPGIEWSGGIRGEHLFYPHGVGKPGALWRGIKARWGGRTAIQVTNRAGENAPSDGNVHIQECHFEDFCLQMGGGGSALTFKGHEGPILVDRVSVLQGCTNTLAPRVADNITGGLVAESSRGTHTPHLTVIDSRFEVGAIHPGRGQARRSNVKIEVADLFELRRTSIIQHAGAFDIALEIQGGVRHSILERACPVIGKVLHRGTKYQDWQEFQSSTASDPSIQWV